MPNQPIPIGDARRISRDRAYPMVLVFGVEESGRFAITTYGANKRLCKVAASLAERFAEAVMDGSVGPPETEPDDMPEVPVMYEGQKGDAT